MIQVSLQIFLSCECTFYIHLSFGAVPPLYLVVPSVTMSLSALGYRCRRLWLVCHHEQGLLETDLPICSLAIPESTVGKGALQAPPPDSTEAQTHWYRFGRLPHQLVHNPGLPVMPVRSWNHS